MTRRFFKKGDLCQIKEGVDPDFLDWFSMPGAEGPPLRLCAGDIVLLLENETETTLPLFHTQKDPIQRQRRISTIHIELVKGKS